ncbi:MAG: hypothetical protein JXQ71_08595 [Verrucomicrobia bacterium]|nr:hypothetical protein [Verrucomicrobiota bacterium]
MPASTQVSAAREPVNEYEREPVPASRLKSLGSFIGLYGGEHVAGTEFMLGPLFLASGVGAFDLLVGLVIGNALAVASWTFICAPVATRFRLTLYFQLEKICGTRLVCVMIAGWTTANPTIYRAGLAFQAILPRQSRAVVTLMAGGMATAAAIFPALAMKLVGFVGLYGTILMPMGAILCVDVYVLPRCGLPSDHAERAGVRFNAAAGLAWGLALALCAVLNQGAGVQIYFLALPGWIMAGGLYLFFSRIRRAGPAGRLTTPHSTERN